MFAFEELEMLIIEKLSHYKDLSKEMIANEQSDLFCKGAVSALGDLLEAISFNIDEEEED